MTTRIARWGNSCAVRLPKDDINKAGFRVDDPVSLLAEDGEIRIVRFRPQRSHRTLSERLGDYAGRLDSSVPDWDGWVGKEVW